MVKVPAEVVVLVAVMGEMGLVQEADQEKHLYDYLLGLKSRHQGVSPKMFRV